MNDQQSVKPRLSQKKFDWFLSIFKGILLFVKCFMYLYEKRDVFAKLLDSIRELF